MITRTEDALAHELDWNLLRTFMVIVQAGGITAAAERLMLRQPTVSQALKRLETRLDKRLIERGNGVFRVTSAGELLYRECVEIYGNVSRIAVLTREIEDEISGNVRIAMASHVVSPLLDAALTDFFQRNRNATFEIEIATSSEVARMVQQKSASLGICLVHEKLPQLDYEVIYREHFGFFCGPNHPLFGRKRLKLDDLKGHTSVSFKTDQFWDVLRPVALLRAQYGLDLRAVGQSSHLEEVRRMIIAGLGIGPLPVHVVERDVQDGLLWRLPPYDDPPAIDIYMLANPRGVKNRAERLFLSDLQARIASMPLEQRTYL